MGIPTGGFADVQEISFEPLPNGDYAVSVFEGELKESKSEKHAGSQYVSWTLNVTEDGPYNNRKLWYNTSLVEEARGMLKAFLLCFFDEDELNSPDFELNVEDIVGQEAIAVVGQGVNPNTGEANNKVRRMKKAGSADTSDMPV